MFMCVCMCAQVREVVCKPDYLPSVHGSAFFQRGDTHVLCTATLGSKDMAKEVVPLTGGAKYSQTFSLQYDFPPYCKPPTVLLYL